ncbi:MAG: hypothetical protein JXK07_09985 [Spirochaetes bacterium]|nr:hypothetical protein [Spirochaetota bacterium]MBN2771273.1 hypothetical protein [Spirochaetota bacterium]
MIESYGWGGYTATVMARTLVGIQSFDDDAKRDVKLHYGKGTTPNGFGRGNYEGTGKMSVNMDEYEKLVVAATPYGGDVTMLPPFPVVGILEKSDGKKFKELYPQVLIEKRGKKRKQGDTEFVVDLDIKLLMPCVETPL